MVCLSTTKTQHVDVTISLKDVEWLFNILTESGFRMKVGYCSNQGAIKIYQGEASRARAKCFHVELQYEKHLLNPKYLLQSLQTQDKLFLESN